MGEPFELRRGVARDAHALAVLLDALCALGLLDKSSAGYGLGTAAAAFLAASASVSPKMRRRSAWPSSTMRQPTSASTAGLTSPV